MPSSTLFLCRTFRSRSVLHGQRTGSSGKHRIWCGIAEQKDVQPLRWSVPHWLLAPGSEVLLSGRFSTLPTPLRIFMLMMREIGERTLYGMRNSFSAKSVRTPQEPVEMIFLQPQEMRKSISCAAAGAPSGAAQRQNSMPSCFTM